MLTDGGKTLDYAKSDVWNKAMLVAEQACLLAGRVRGHGRFAMRSQLVRAAISVPSNLAEGWRRDSPKDKAHFFSIAHGSLAELQTQIVLSTRLGWIAGKEATTFFELADDVGAMLAALRQSWKKRTRRARPEQS